MRGHLRGAAIATGTLVAAVALYLSLTLPSPTVELGTSLRDTAVPGAYHVHSTRSDGTGTVAEVATAAARAGLAFVILSDHGDATRQPDPPTYRDGVLCIDAVEIGTDDGHLVALGLEDAAPYPLAGSARDVVEDVHRLGGLAIIAHPDSPKADLRWRAPSVPFDGIEWLNADSEWRDDGPLRLLGSGLRSLLRGPESITTLFARPGRTFRRWDSAARTRPVFGLAAADAHARIGWQEDEEPRERTALARPSYEALFRTLAQVVLLDAPLSGDPVADARRLIDAIGAGQSFSAVRSLAWPALLEYSAVTPAGEPIRMGDRAAPTSWPIEFTAAVTAAPDARVSLVADGQEVAFGRGALRHAASSPGVYRVEVARPGAPVPWIVSNPIVLTGSAEAPVARTSDPEPDAWQPLSGQEQAWEIETDSSSDGTATLVADDDAVRFDFALGPGDPSGQYAALAAPLDAEAGIDRVQFVGRADRPHRASIQIRLPGASTGGRWRHSVYLDETPRTITVAIEAFTSAEGLTSRRPVVVPIETLLVVVDTVNAEPGRRGSIWLSDVRLGVALPAAE